MGSAYFYIFVIYNNIKNINIKVCNIFIVQLVPSFCLYATSFIGIRKFINN